MKLDINLTADQLKVATATYQGAVLRKETQARDMVEYLTGLLADEFQTALDQRVNDIVSSWAMLKDPALQERKDALVDKIAALPDEKLAAIEAIIDGDTAI